MPGERIEKNNRYLTEFGINKRSSISSGGHDYTRETVLDVLYLPIWKQLSQADRLQCIVWIFEKRANELGLHSYLENILFVPKPGYESAFASYDKEVRGIFINPDDVTQPTLLSIWSLFHELRHAVQHREEDLIRMGELPMSDFHQSFRYYFMYDGTTYRFYDGSQFIYKLPLPETVCRELYLRNPMELDANQAAYVELRSVLERNMERLGSDDETFTDLQKVKDLLLPDFKIITDDIAGHVVKLCQSIVELAYEFSLDTVAKSDHDNLQAELYNAIDKSITSKKPVNPTLSINGLDLKSIT